MERKLTLKVKTQQLNYLKKANKSIHDSSSSLVSLDLSISNDFPLVSSNANITKSPPTTEKIMKMIMTPYRSTSSRRNGNNLTHANADIYMASTHIVKPMVRI